MSPAKNQASGETSICPWCSAAVPAEVSRCPSCGAALRDAVDDEVPGVTQVDLQATSKLARLKPPGRVAMWLGAERTTENPELSGRIEPPSEEVRKEMLRLELAAIDAEIETTTTLAEAQRKLPPEERSADAAPPLQSDDASADAAPPLQADDASGDADKEALA
jgi:hypothetical protein